MVKKDLRRMDSIDLDELRPALKLIKNSGTKRSFKNKKGLKCPACGQKFYHVMESEEEHNKFSPTGSKRFCVTRQDDRIFIFTHD